MKRIYEPTEDQLREIRAALKAGRAPKTQHVVRDFRNDRRTYRRYVYGAPILIFATFLGIALILLFLGVGAARAHTGGGCCYITYIGHRHVDYVVGHDGNSYLTGRGGNDRLYGAQGNDRLYGGAGNDILYGGMGRDYCVGGDGYDVLVGCEGGTTG